MNKLISSKTAALTFGVLTVCFVIGFYAIAWQEPSQTPPSGNVSAPLNVVSTVQTKSGALTVAAGGGDALILKNGGDLRIYNADNSGSALIYVDANGEVITPGNFKVGSVTIKGDGAISTNLNADKVDDYHAADLLAAGGGGSFELSCGWYSLTYAVGSCTPPACPTGYQTSARSCVVNAVVAPSTNPAPACYSGYTAIGTYCPGVTCTCNYAYTYPQYCEYGLSYSPCINAAAAGRCYTVCYK